MIGPTNRDYLFNTSITLLIIMVNQIINWLLNFMVSSTLVRVYFGDIIYPGGVFILNILNYSLVSFNVQFNSLPLRLIPFNQILDLLS